MKTVVKMFQPRFADMVEFRLKLQTVRKTPKGDQPKAGDIISCRKWNDAPYRSPQIHIYHSIIESVEPVTIESDSVSVSGIAVDKEKFALMDGFRSWEDMQEWFKYNHGLPFTGILIKWT